MKDFDAGRSRGRDRLAGVDARTMAPARKVASPDGAAASGDPLASVAFDLLAAVYMTLAQQYEAANPGGYAGIDDLLTRQMIEDLTTVYDDLPQGLDVDIAFQALVLRLRNVMARARSAAAARPSVR